MVSAQSRGTLFVTLNPRDLEFWNTRMSASLEQSENLDSIASRTRYHKPESVHDGTKKGTIEKSKKSGKGKKPIKGKEDEEMEIDVLNKKTKRNENEESEEASDGDKLLSKKRKTKENVEFYDYPEQERIKKITPPARVLEQQPLIHPNYNADISKILTELGEIKKNLGDRFKYQQYMTAVESLTAYPKRVSSGIYLFIYVVFLVSLISYFVGEEALKLDGVGYKISKKIQEILDTKSLKELDQAKHDPRIHAINELCQIHGIGSETARYKSIYYLNSSFFILKYIESLWKQELRRLSNCAMNPLITSNKLASNTLTT